MTALFNLVLVASLWQDAAIAAAAYVALTLARTPRVRYAIGCAALAAMAIVPVATAATTARTNDDSPALSDAVIAGAPTPTPVGASLTSPEPRRFSWMALAESWALPLWCVGVLVCSLRLLGSSAHAMVVARRSVVADATTCEIVARLASRLGIRRAISVRTALSGVGPATIGWLRPIVLVPSSAALGLTSEQLEAVLAHELAHIRRHDYLVNLAQLLIETLFFYHPAVWWLSQRIHAERELCCDDMAVAMCGSSLRYAKALAVVARHTAAPATAVAAARGSIVARVQRLVAPDGERRSPIAVSAAAATVVAMLMVAPVWVHAQRDGSAPPAAGSAAFSGTLYDPLGRPAENAPIILTEVGPGTNRPFEMGTTDATGHFRFAPIQPGRYAVHTPLTDYVAPEFVEVRTAEDRPVDVRMSVDEIATNLRVCRDCRPTASPSARPGAIEPTGGPLVVPAEPLAGWDAFNAATYSYPDALKGTRLEGNVLVEGRVDSDGSTVDVHAVSSPDRRLSEAALALVRPLRWRPTRVRGVALAAPLHVTVEFSVRGDQ